MRKKEDSLKMRKKPEVSGSPTRESKFRLIKKPKETALSSEIRAEIAFNESETASPLVPPLPHDLNARIQARAHELYERRGGNSGKDLEDWAEAERQILSERP